MGVRRVINGTPQFDKVSLCESCRNSQRLKGERYEHDIVHCHALDKRITFKVIECDRYDDANHPSLFEMRLIAWRFASDLKGNPIGFKNPKQFADLKRAGKVEEKEGDNDDY